MIYEGRETTCYLVVQNMAWHLTKLAALKEVLCKMERTCALIRGAGARHKWVSGASEQETSLIELSYDIRLEYMDSSSSVHLTRLSASQMSSQECITRIR